MQSHRFALSTEQFELLQALESCRTLGELSAKLGRDPSVVSRQLARISSSSAASVLEKVRGSWTLSPLGREVAQWSQQARLSLEQLLRRRRSIRVGATREFAARVLCPQTPAFLDEIAPGSELTLLTAEVGIESLVLGGEIDFGFDCGAPGDPAVQFRKVKREPLGVFSRPGFFGRRAPTQVSTLLAQPCVQYRRISTARYLGLTTDVPRTAGYFNDLAAIREACCAGLGWAVLPAYSVSRELVEKRLEQARVRIREAEHFGVWWPRGNSAAAQLATRAVGWLSKQRL